MVQDLVADVIDLGVLVALLLVLNQVAIGLYNSCLEDGRHLDFGVVFLHVDDT